MGIISDNTNAEAFVSCSQLTGGHTVWSELAVFLVFLINSKSFWKISGELKSSVVVLNHNGYIMITGLTSQAFTLSSIAVEPIRSKESLSQMSICMAWRAR